jgi:hypothetical protein
MSITTYSRKASVDEISAEMDRRGAVIKSLEAERDGYLEALRDIDAVGVDFGHYEDAARTMKTIARDVIEKDLNNASSLSQDARDLIEIIEGVKGTVGHGTWRDDSGMRLKDTPEWVAFYVTVNKSVK